MNKRANAIWSWLRYHKLPFIVAIYISRKSDSRSEIIGSADRYRGGVPGESATRHAGTETLSRGACKRKRRLKPSLSLWEFRMSASQTEMQQQNDY
jgi:hypothetical protein